MAQGYLIDTNAIIGFCNGKLPVAGKSLLLSMQPQVSIITNIELFATKAISRAEYELLEKFIAISVVHPVAANLIETAIAIRQNNKLKLPDAIIAATALVRQLVLLTRNTSDFASIQGLQIIDPYKL